MTSSIKSLLGSTRLDEAFGSKTLKYAIEPIDGVDWLKLRFLTIYAKRFVQRAWIQKTSCRTLWGPSSCNNFMKIPSINLIFFLIYWHAICIDGASGVPRFPAHPATWRPSVCEFNDLWFKRMKQLLTMSSSNAAAAKSWPETVCSTENGDLGADTVRPESVPSKVASKSTRASSVMILHSITCSFIAAEL